MHHGDGLVCPYFDQSNYRDCVHRRRNRGGEVGGHSRNVKTAGAKGNIFLPFFAARSVCIARTMLSQDVCPSVRLSHVGIVSKHLNISPNDFHSRLATPL